MEIAHTGKIVNYDILESFIKSRKKMTYKNVNSILENNIVPSGYEEFEKDLKEGKKVDIKKYLTDNTKKYDNKVTDIGNTLSDMINNGISGGLEKTFKVVEKLIE